ncbi:hypothetical protein F4806DRAFT_310968 [Annulohypoxylon nitens]|nr:hypothetical protein F4806DRAFT_310968 [Annulohypoxylon nitens]
MKGRGKDRVYSHFGSGDTFFGYDKDYDAGAGTVESTSSSSRSRNHAASPNPARSSGRHEQYIEPSTLFGYTSQMPLSNPSSPTPSRTSNAVSERPQRAPRPTPNPTPNPTVETEPCPKCGKDISVEGMSRHIKRIHRKPPQNDSTKGISRWPFKGGNVACDECDASFADEVRLRHHKGRIHNPNSSYSRSMLRVEGGLPCSQQGCERRFENQDQLARHVKKYHR